MPLKTSLLNKKLSKENRLQNIRVINLQRLDFFKNSSYTIILILVSLITANLLLKSTKKK